VAADLTGKLRLQVRQANAIAPAIGIDDDRMCALVVAAIDQQLARAAGSRWRALVIVIPVLTGVSPCCQFFSVKKSLDSANGLNGPMTKPLLLTVCAVLVAFGIFTIAVSAGVFVQLLGAIIMALGGSAGYMILVGLN
jgi:hypothetical protein